MKKIVQSCIQTIQDYEGNVVEKRSNLVFRHGAEPDYIKLYLDTILYLSDLPAWVNGTLLYFLKRATYASSEQVVYMNSCLKNEMMASLQVSKSTIDKAITNLVKSNIIYRKGRGTYVINPNLFGKGEWKDIENIRLEVDFNYKKGITFNSIIENMNEKTKKEMKKSKLEVITGGQDE